ncbi:MAG: BtpA/SgcQ family protein [Flavobacteriaceae bacterium]|nr:BtpA/SgcQ family protein [Flavobacteriaceae bacterium]
MDKFKLIFGQKKVAIGVIHLQALPGTPQNKMNPNEIVNVALEEAKIYKRGGIDALIIENMHDIPYMKNDVGHEVSSLMAIIGHLVKEETNLPLGIQVLAGANKAAMAVAKNSGADFIRAEGYVFGHLADEGYIDAQASELLRYRKQIGADHIGVFTDIKKKHSSHALTGDLSLLETARAAEFFLSDGIIITGSHTGTATSIDQLKAIRNQLNIPVLVGSGITIENFKEYLPLCNAMIIGSYFKENGLWSDQLSYERIAGFMEAFHL